MDETFIQFGESNMNNEMPIPLSWAIEIIH